LANAESALNTQKSESEILQEKIKTLIAEKQEYEKLYNKTGIDNLIEENNLYIRKLQIEWDQKEKIYQRKINELYQKNTEYVQELTNEKLNWQQKEKEYKKEINHLFHQSKFYEEELKNEKSETRELDTLLQKNSLNNERPSKKLKQEENYLDLETFEKIFDEALDDFKKTLKYSTINDEEDEESWTDGYEDSSDDDEEMDLEELQNKVKDRLPPGLKTCLEDHEKCKNQLKNSTGNSDSDPRLDFTWDLFQGESHEIPMPWSIHNNCMNEGRYNYN
jgi:hypothetical protein